MSDRRKDVEKAHAELGVAFGSKGGTCANLRSIEALEESYQAAADDKFGGYRLLHKCFMSLLYEGLECANRLRPEIPQTEQWQWYASTLAFMANIFTRARASETLLLYGYPLEGYALLRDLKDRAVFLAAILLGITDLKSVLGFTSDGRLSAVSSYWEANRLMVSRRKAEHKKMFEQMAGRSSGLPDNVKEDLKRWEELFHGEVHLSIHSFFVEGAGIILGEGELPAGPQQTEIAIGMYLNRSIEVAWLLVRTLPILQPQPFALGQDWANRWSLLERVLDQAVSASAEDKKDLVPSLCYWVREKFAFDPSWSFLGSPRQSPNNKVERADV